MLDSIFAWTAQIPPNVWGIGLTIWLLVAIGNSDERDTFMKNTWLLLTGPSKLDDYSEEWLEKAEKGFRNSLLSPTKKFLSWLVKAVHQIWNKYQWKLIGQLVLLLFLPFFFVADAIAIYNILDTMGLPVENWPDNILNILAQYGIAVAAGTFFSIVVSGFVLFEIFGKSEFSEFGEYPDGAKRIVKVSAIFLVVSSMVSGISLGFVAWELTGNMPASLAWTDGLVHFSMNILVRANVLLATTIILLEALKGLRSVIVILLGFAIILMGIIGIIFGVIGALGRIIFDLVSRVILWLMWLISFLVFAPFDVIKSSPRNLIEFLVNLFQKGKS